MIPRGDGGEMLVKIYEPIERNRDKLPAMLWIHGGGFVMGHPDMDDLLCERFVQTANCVVVSIDYRLAPEHPYPAAIEDCYAGLVWMTAEAPSLGIDVKRVAIAGASGGGGLTAALALMARDKEGPQLYSKCHYIQCLITEMKHHLAMRLPMLKQHGVDQII